MVYGTDTSKCNTRQISYTLKRCSKKSEEEKGEEPIKTVERMTSALHLEGGRKCSRQKEKHEHISSEGGKSSWAGAERTRGEQDGTRPERQGNASCMKCLCVV